MELFSKLKNSILLVDDDAKIRDLLSRFLIENNFSVKTASNVPQARSFLLLQNFDLIILDIMMPEESGIDLLSEIRNNSRNHLKEIPVFFLTAKDNLESKVLGFSCGADDYITKPFEPQELILRINSIMKRLKNNHDKTKNSKEADEFKLGDFIFSYSKGILSHKDIEIKLSFNELVLLRTLAQKPYQPFSREELAQKIGNKVSDRSIDVQITRIRQKINDVPPKYIQTIRHIGYSLCPD
jgi:two-component system, OmpR family, phosphate regulon response regulator OmpR